MVVTSVMFTQSDSVNEPRPAVRAPSRAHRWWAIPTAVLGGLAVFAPVVASVVPADSLVDRSRCAEYADDGITCLTQNVAPAQFALVPADAEPVEPRLDVAGTPTFAEDGQIYFVTVREPEITLLDWFGIALEPSVRLRSYEDKYGTGTSEDRLREGQRQMTGAKDWAIYTALTRAGYDARMVSGPAQVDYVICLRANDANTECLESPPAADFLEEYDVITSVDGQDVTVLDDLDPIISVHQPGDVVDITVLRDGQEVSGRIELIASPADSSRTILGFIPIDTRTLQLPAGLSVDIETDSIGGPSAGLAFTLAIIDEVTEGSLTGGLNVAVTGTINEDGSVGAIGGLNSKASAVQQVGVRYFLVPESQGYDERSPDSIPAAEKVVGDNVQIIPVATLDDALEALAALGGDPIPAVAAPPTTAA